MTKQRVNALIVSDRVDLVPVLECEGDIAVVAQVTTGAVALACIATERPDIVLLDLNLRSGSHDVIGQIMDQAPTPILVLTARVDGRRSPSAVLALVAGALDALPLPERWSAEQGSELRQAVRRLSKAWVIRHLRGNSSDPEPSAKAKPRNELQPAVAMAASTGGPTAFATVLAELGGLPVPVLVVQHLHPEFIGGLLEWMSRVSALPVSIAEHGERAKPGQVYLAPGGVHLRLGRRSCLELDTEPASIHRPSADILFTSVAEQSGPAGIGVVLTGMGDDGARGLLAIRRRGGHTIAQDEESSAVFGMPRAAQRLGAVGDLHPLSQVAAAIRQHAFRAVTRARP
jgi:two-component system chemotaxis response regulator CheB